jgi:hypothetical protein
MMLFQPDALALMTGQHLALGGECGADVNREIGLHRVAVAVETFDRVGVIKMGDRSQRSGRAAVVIGSGGREAGIAHQGTGGLMVTVIINGRSRDHNIGLDATENFGHAAAGGVIIKHRQVSKFGANVFGSDDRGRGGGFGAANGRYLVSRILFGTAISGRHAGDGHSMAAGGQQRHGAAGQDFYVIRVCMNGEDSHVLRLCQASDDASVLVLIEGAHGLGLHAAQGGG